MTALITLPDHDMDGIAHLNNNFQYLEQLGKQAVNTANDAANIEFHDWLKDGIVMHNSFSLMDNSGYRYWVLHNGVKLVEVLISSQLSTTNFHGGEWFTLPDIVKPNSRQIKETIVGGYYTDQSSANTVNLNASSSTAIESGGWVHTLHTMYFSN